MNKRNYLKMTFRRVIGFALALSVLVALLSPINVQAKTKTVSPKYYDFSYSGNGVARVAKTVKTGSTVVNLKSAPYRAYSGGGYLKFVATKSKTYSFTLSNVKGDNYTSCYMKVQLKQKNNIPKLLYIKSGGQTDVSISAASRVIYPMGKKKTGKISLKRGQVIYIYMGTEHQGAKKVSCKLTIK